MPSKFLEELKELKVELCRVGSAYEGLHNKVTSEFHLDDLKGNLSGLPNDIALHQREAVKTKASIAELESKMKIIEVELSYVINMETNGQDKAGKDKPKFSNADSRKAELNRRLEQNDPYQEAHKEKVNLESLLFNTDIEIDRLRNQFKSAIALKDLIVAELNLYIK